MLALARIFVAVSLALTSAMSAAADVSWPTHALDAGPGAFATITIEQPRHGGEVQGPDTTIRLRTDNPNAALRVQIDGKDVDRDGRPHTGPKLSATDYPQWEFMDRHELAVPVRGLAPGLHELVVRSGGIGTSLPRTNEHRITFIVK